MDKHLSFTKGSYRRSFKSPAHELGDPEKVKQIFEYFHVNTEDVFDNNRLPRLGEDGGSGEGIKIRIVNATIV